MPSLTISLPDLGHLMGHKLSLQELERLIEYAKGEVDGFDEQTGDATISLDDTNLPYLWSTEGLARFFKGVLGKEKGIPSLSLKPSGHKIIADASVKNVRPHIAAFIARGPAVTDASLRQMVQLQEKFCDNYGRKRANASIGLYSFKRISFPVHYKAVTPDGVRFVPLEGASALSLKEILAQHPKGIEYAHTLAGKKHYPLLVDNKDAVLSFPPIINSNDLGKVEVGDTEFLFECTGLSEEATHLGTAIFAYALADRGYHIETLDIVHAHGSITTPLLEEESFHITPSQVESLLGLTLSQEEIAALLEKARYGVSGDSVRVPAFRRDTLHPVDVIEDVGILHGYNTIEDEPMRTYTVGGTLPLQNFVDRCREACVGLGYLELFSPVLSNKHLINERARMPDPGTVEIANPMSESYAIIRTSLLPLLLDVLSSNKHVAYPQLLFEQGLVTRRHGDGIVDFEMLSLANTHAKTTFTDIKQAVDALISSLGLKATYAALEHPTFIAGRAASVFVNGVHAGILGEVHPQVLENFGLELPVGLAEMNLNALFPLAKK